MGRLESLTAWALGRGPYEDEPIVQPVRHIGQSGYGQRFNDHGRPINPETRRRERESVRAANEVMQVTGVVEDSTTAKAELKAFKIAKNQETFFGLRMMEFGRASLVGGVWGVLGLRRRILVYKPYVGLSILGILRHESTRSVPTISYAGLPSVFAFHVSDWVGFFVTATIDDFLDGDEKYTQAQLLLKYSVQTMLDISFYYITLHLRMFALVQQLHLMPASRLFPSLMSFIPFTNSSPFQLPPNPSFNIASMMSWGSALLATTAPLLAILAHGKAKYFISKLLYRPIYKSLPRPKGDSMFAGLSDAVLEYDIPDRDSQTPGSSRAPAELTPNIAENGLRAPLDSLRARRARAADDSPRLEPADGQNPRDLQPEGQQARPEALFEIERDSSDEEDTEMAQATLISFDVEATESMDNSVGGWSAELRSANEPKPSTEVKYRVTGLTLLPTILATEGIREVIAGLLVMPLEAVMVRVIARAYRHSAGLGISDIYGLGGLVPAAETLFSVFTLQMAVTGVVWIGFTAGCHLWGIRMGYPQLLLKPGDTIREVELEETGFSNGRPVR